MIGKGSPTRVFEQEIAGSPIGQPSEIKNSCIDPTTGPPFLQTTRANWVATDKMGQVKSHKNKQTSVR